MKKILAISLLVVLAGCKENVCVQKHDEEKRDKLVNACLLSYFVQPNENIPGTLVDECRQRAEVESRTELACHVEDHTLIDGLKK